MTTDEVDALPSNYAALEHEVVETFKNKIDDFKHTDDLAKAFYEGARGCESSIFWESPAKWRDLPLTYRLTFRAGVRELVAQQKFEREVFDSI